MLKTVASHAGHWNVSFVPAMYSSLMSTFLLYHQKPPLSFLLG